MLAFSAVLYQDTKASSHDAITRNSLPENTDKNRNLPPIATEQRKRAVESPLYLTGITNIISIAARSPRIWVFLSLPNVSEAEAEEQTGSRARLSAAIPTGLAPRTRHHHFRPGGLQAHGPATRPPQCLAGTLSRRTVREMGAGTGCPGYQKGLPNAEQDGWSQGVKHPSASGLGPAVGLARR